MKRSELYALVWAKPLMHLAQEFGMSGPGLAKLCDRHGIPTPHRGHWAKLRAGKRSKQVPLPQPGLDVTVGLPTAAQRERRDETKAFNHRLRAARAPATAPGAVVTQGEPASAEQHVAASKLAGLKVADALERPHPLVRATALVVQQLPAQLARFERATPAQRASASFKIPPLAHRGRHELNVAGGLALTASLQTMEWVLRFVDALLKGLIRAGARIERSTRPGDRMPTLRVERDGEVLVLSPVVESFRRQEIDPEELEEIQKSDKWASKWRYTPSGRLSLSAQGTERIVHTGWSGTPEKLESQLVEIVATCIDLLERQPEYRQARESAEAERQREAEQRARSRRKAEARQKLLERTLEAAQQYEQELALRRFLEMIERDADRFNAPYPERAKVWLSVVRAQLEEFSPWRRTLGMMLSGQSWEAWPPEWWPSADVLGD